MLTLLILIPLLGSLIILLMSNSKAHPLSFVPFVSNVPYIEECSSKASSKVPSYLTNLRYLTAGGSYATSPKAKGGSSNINLYEDIPSSEAGRSPNQRARAMKKIALTTSLINFFISLFLWYEFDSSCATQFQFVSEFNQLSFCHLNFGVDGISLYFVLLTTFVTPIALLSNYTNIKSLRSYPALPVALHPKSKGSPGSSAPYYEGSCVATRSTSQSPMEREHLRKVEQQDPTESNTKAGWSSNTEESVRLRRGDEKAGGDQNLKLFLISILVLETLQICAFVSLDLLLFYIFFESVK
jgi:hypothetical protein